MKTLFASAALAAAVMVPTAASAQAVPAATIAVIDLDRVTTECNACKTALATLRSQGTAFENRRNTLNNQLRTEQRAIQTAVDALKGAEPDAALRKRYQDLQTKAEQSERELATQQQQVQRNAQYIQQQITEKLGPIYTQVMQRRGANIMMEVGATLGTAQSLDVTQDVLTALNAALPRIVTNAPAQPQQPRPATPQGR